MKRLKHTVMACITYCSVRYAVLAVRSGASVCKIVFIIVAAFVFSTLGVVRAEQDNISTTSREVVDWLQMDYSLRGAYWSSDRKLNSANNFGVSELWLRSQPRLSENVSGRFEGWVIDQDLFRGERPTFELRESYLSYRGNSFDVSIGRRIVVWGRADKINPTDTISSRDRTLLFPEDDDQRRGNFMMTGNYSVNESSNVSVYWLPEFRPNVIPITSGPGVNNQGKETSAQLLQFAAKYEYFGKGVDWSFSYFDGLDRNPNLAITAVGPQGVSFIQRYYRVRAIGFDASTIIGRYGLRSEVAYVRTKDETGTNPEIYNPYLFAVIGGDRDVAQNFNVNVQYLFHYTFSYQSPNTIQNPIFRAIGEANNLLSLQTHQVLHGLSVRLNHRWLNDSLETSLTSVVFFNDGDFLITPKITYKVTDNVRISVGGDYYSGSTNTVLGRLKDNNTGYIALRFGY